MESIKQILKNNRCDFCNKKCGLFSFKCRCGYKFCNEHRYSFMHCSDFDYQSFERDMLKIHLPKVVKDKIINKI